MKDWKFNLKKVRKQFSDYVLNTFVKWDENSSMTFFFSDFYYIFYNRAVDIVGEQKVLKLISMSEIKRKKYRQNNSKMSSQIDNSKNQ